MSVAECASARESRSYYPGDQAVTQCHGARDLAAGHFKKPWGFFRNRRGALSYD